MANPSRNDKPHAEWANRLMFAHDNAADNVCQSPPLARILNAADYSTNCSLVACMVDSRPASRI